MNNALNIKNWSDGGNNYVLKGNPKNKWVGFQETVLIELEERFKDKFNIVIWTNPNKEEDYYCIPYSQVKHLFTDEHKTKGKYKNRWTAIILEHNFLMHSNSRLAVDISHYYSSKILSIPLIDIDEDYYIENAKAEIAIRIGQSKFRKGVLENFEFKCALSNINESCLLRASHIIPWSDKKEFRADIANGICLYIEYDALFDEGLISLTDNLEIIAVTDTAKLSNELKGKLEGIRGKRLNRPKNKQIKKEYLDYHRREIFKG